MYKDKFINVTRSSMPPIEEYVEEITDLWESRWLTNYGLKYNILEKKLCDYLAVENIAMFNNGHSALEVALSSCDLSGEVITTPFTFVSTTNAVCRTGLKPVFCDIDKESLCIDVNKIEKLINEKTKAILPVHVYGRVCDVERIQEIANKYGLKVIYDGAHAFGVKIHGKGIGNFGDMTMFSFHATKVFHTIEGGAIAYRNRGSAKLIKELQNFGLNEDGDVCHIAGNFKMNEFQAAMGICNLKYIDQNIKRRKKVFERYLERLSHIKGIIIPEKQQNVESNYAYFPVIFSQKLFGKNRDYILDKLKLHNIFARRYFYPLTNEYSAYINLKYKAEDTPIAKNISDNVLTLPLFEGLTVADVDNICDIILDD